MEISHCFQSSLTVEMKMPRHSITITWWKQEKQAWRLGSVQQSAISMKDRIIKNYLKYNSYNNCSKEQMVFQDSTEHICLVKSPTFKLVKHLHKFRPGYQRMWSSRQENTEWCLREHKKRWERLLGRRQRNWKQVCSWLCKHDLHFCSPVSVYSLHESLEEAMQSLGKQPGEAGLSLCKLSFATVFTSLKYMKKQSLVLTRRWRLYMGIPVRQTSPTWVWL